MRSPDIKLAPISVIVPCYRCGPSLEVALNSILDQSLPPKEIIIVDDASGDQTGDFIISLTKGKEDLIKVLSLKKNGGPGVARNHGWESATQPWLAFLDADDAWHPRKLEVQWNWLNQHSEVVLVGHDSRVFSGSLNTDIDIEPPAQRVTFKEMLVSNRILTRTAMVRRDIPYRFGTARFSEDYRLWLSLVAEGYPTYRLNEKLAFSFRAEYSKGGLSENLWGHEVEELKTFWFLHRKGKLTKLEIAFASFWSFVKFLRRAMIRLVSA